MMSTEMAIYKFSYCGEIYYVTRETDERVHFNGSNSIKSSIKKKDLRQLHKEGKVEFSTETGPDFIKEVEA